MPPTTLKPAQVVPELLDDELLVVVPLLLVVAVPLLLMVVPLLLVPPVAVPFPVPVPPVPAPPVLPVEEPLLPPQAATATARDTHAPKALFISMRTMVACPGRRGNPRAPGHARSLVVHQTLDRDDTTALPGALTEHAALVGEIDHGGAGSASPGPHGKGLRPAPREVLGCGPRKAARRPDGIAKRDPGPLNLVRKCARFVSRFNSLPP
jgi:hypothetical protein